MKNYKIHIIWLALLATFLIGGISSNATEVTKDGVKFPDGSIQTTASAPATTTGGKNIYSTFLNVSSATGAEVQYTILTVPAGQTFVLTDLINRLNTSSVKVQFFRNAELVFLNPYSSSTPFNFHLTSGIPFPSGSAFKLKFSSTEAEAFEGNVFISGYYITP